jgi:hypothetical protein
VLTPNKHSGVETTPTRATSLDLAVKYGAILTFLLLTSGSIRLSAFCGQFNMPVEWAMFPTLRILVAGVLTVLELLAIAVTCLAFQRVVASRSRRFQVFNWLLPVLLVSAYHAVEYRGAPAADVLKHSLALALGAYTIVGFVRFRKTIQSSYEYELVLALVFFLILCFVAQYRGVIDARIYASLRASTQLVFLSDSVAPAKALGMSFSNQEAPTVSDPTRLLLISDRVIYVRLANGKVVGISRDRVSMLSFPN